MKKVSILGAGWLGLSLAEQLQTSGYEVIGTYRSNARKVDLSQLNIPALYVDLDKSHIPEELFLSDILCIFIPPSKTENYIESLKKIVNHPSIKRIKHIIFTSSTSVYTSTPEEKTEESLLEKDKHTVQSEYLFEENSATCILRLAGLMGEDRYLSKYYPKEVPNALTPVNHVHKEDVIKILLKVIEGQVTGVYNVCAPLHPSREEIIEYQCNKLLKDQPHFEQKALKKGIVSTKKLIQKLDYMYTYPNPIYFPLIKNQDAIWYNPSIF